MQAQRNRTELQSISSAQSMAAVQTLLRAGLGCITYLRNLLPEDNFTESHFASSDDSLPYDSSQGSISLMENAGGRKVNSFKIMTMSRGHTNEADTILNYLEYGIFDALQRQYLRSFIFAVYLESNDPNNIVEAYTFNFQYQKLAGSEYVVPVMTLGDGLRNMSLSESPRIFKGPATEASKGTVPTVKDVKRNVKALLKTLIHVMSQMDVLPRRRYATFKVFYTDDTPPDYEPPHFKAGDVHKDKWFLMTHDLDEVPDRWSIGTVQTGHHAVNLNIASVATYLPSATENENDAFAGTTSVAPPRHGLTPVQEAARRAQEAEKQSKDAECRNVAWSAEECLELSDAGAEYEEDPNYVMGPDGRYERVTSCDCTTSFLQPVGLRNEKGGIQPYTISSHGASETEYGGFSEYVPKCLKEIAMREESQVPDIDETQSLTDTRGVLVFTQIETEEGDTEMLDMETQKDSQQTESIQSLDREFMEGAEIVKHDDPIDPTPTPTPAEVTKETVDNGLQCECGVSIEDDGCCFCEGGCGRWFHAWCMGFHSIQDSRIPSKFVCFECRARADQSWELMKLDLYPKMLSKYKELALFRRAIKVAELEKLIVPAHFAKPFGGDHSVARQLIKRLENEGFISELVTTVDELDFSETRNKSKKKGKSKAKQTKLRKAVQKTRYMFNRAIKSTKAYTDYFNPSQRVESRLLDILPQSRAKVASKIKASEELPVAQSLSTIHETNEESQTQIESQTPVVEDSLKKSNLKRPMQEPYRSIKRVKISMATGVDLAE